MEQWPEQEGPVVGENELAEVMNLANEAVANAMMQHPEQPQDSTSVSTDTRAFLRAQGTLVILELPLSINGNRSHSSNSQRMQRVDQRMQDFESDFQIRQLAHSLGLHRGFGPVPSVDMLLGHIFDLFQGIQASLPMKNPVPTYTIHPRTELMLNPWLQSMDNLSWGNNAEASSSRGPRAPRLQLIQGFALDTHDSHQIANAPHTGDSQTQMLQLMDSSDGIHQVERNLPTEDTRFPDPRL